jgi:hypothetical protein
MTRDDRRQSNRLCRVGIVDGVGPEMSGWCVTPTMRETVKSGSDGRPRWVLRKRVADLRPLGVGQSDNLW